MRNTSKQDLGNRLHFERLKRRLTLDQLSGISGINKTHLSEMEHGKVCPKIETLDLLISSLQVDYRNLYRLYLSQISTVESCYHFIDHCLHERKDVSIAKQAIRKLFAMTRPSKISLESIDLLIIFFDKKRE